MTMKTSDRDALALQVWEQAVCSPSDHIGDALSIWLAIAEQAARCLAEHVRAGGPENLAGAAGVAEAIRRSVMIGRIIGEAMHREALAADRQARLPV